jgi:histidinol-phosphate aminotransferase
MTMPGSEFATRLIRPDLRAVGAYRLRQPTIHSVDPARLHQNEAPADWPEAVKREIAERLIAIPWHRYPSARADGVRAALGDLQSTPAAMIAATAGSNEALWVVFASFASGGTVVMPSPTYSMAKPLAIAAGARVIDVPLGPGFALNADAVLRAAHAHGAEVIYLATPNNPTANAFAREAVEAVLAGAPGAVAVDEAYWEFASHRWIDAVAGHPHLVVIRTFSKAMAGAGIRLGWLTAHEALIAEFTKALPPYNLNVFAQVAIPVLVARRDIAVSRIRAIVAERERVAAAMRALGVRVYPSETNFLLFAPGPAAEGRTASDVWERIVARGVLVRDVSSAPSLGECLRVSVGEPADNDRFLSALAGALRGDAP